MEAAGNDPFAFMSQCKLDAAARMPAATADRDVPQARTPPRPPCDGDDADATPVRQRSCGASVTALDAALSAQPTATARDTADVAARPTVRLPDGAAPGWPAAAMKRARSEHDAPGPHDAGAAAPPHAQAAGGDGFTTNALLDHPVWQWASGIGQQGNAVPLLRAGVTTLDDCAAITDDVCERAGVTVLAQRAALCTAAQKLGRELSRRNAAAARGRGRGARGRAGVRGGDAVAADNNGDAVVRCAPHAAPPSLASAAFDGVVWHGSATAPLATPPTTQPGDTAGATGDVAALLQARETLRERIAAAVDAYNAQLDAIAAARAERGAPPARTVSQAVAAAASQDAVCIARLLGPIDVTVTSRGDGDWPSRHDDGSRHDSIAGAAASSSRHSAARGGSAPRGDSDDGAAAVPPSPTATLVDTNGGERESDATLTYSKHVPSADGSVAASVAASSYLVASSAPRHSSGDRANSNESTLPADAPRDHEEAAGARLPAGETPPSRAVVEVISLDDTTPRQPPPPLTGGATDRRSGAASSLRQHVIATASGNTTTARSTEEIVAGWEYDLPQPSMRSDESGAVADAPSAPPRRDVFAEFGLHTAVSQVVDALGQQSDAAVAATQPADDDDNDEDVVFISISQRPAASGAPRAAPPTRTDEADERDHESGDANAGPREVPPPAEVEAMPLDALRSLVRSFGLHTRAPAHAPRLRHALRGTAGAGDDGNASSVAFGCSQATGASRGGSVGSASSAGDATSTCLAHPEEAERALLIQKLRVLHARTVFHTTLLPGLRSECDIFNDDDGASAAATQAELDALPAAQRTQQQQRHRGEQKKRQARACIAALALHSVQRDVCARPTAFTPFEHVVLRNDVQLYDVVAAAQTHAPAVPKTTIETMLKTSGVTMSAPLVEGPNGEARSRPWSGRGSGRGGWRGGFFGRARGGVGNR